MFNKGQSEVEKKMKKISNGNEYTWNCHYGGGGAPPFVGICSLASGNTLYYTYNIKLGRFMQSVLQFLLMFQI